MYSDKVSLKDLVELYVDMQNLLEGLTPTRLQNVLKGYDETRILDIKRNAISQKLVELIDATILRKTNLRIGASPFLADTDAILAEIENGV